MSEPITRYINGINYQALNDIQSYVAGLLGRPLAETESDAVMGIMKKHAYYTMLDAMPIQVGIDYVSFLVNLVINHYRFTSTHLTACLLKTS